MLGIGSVRPHLDSAYQPSLSHRYIEHLAHPTPLSCVMALLLLNGLSSGHSKGDGTAMLKITIIQESGSDVLLKLEGKITAQWAALLDGECRSFLRQRKRVCLDCSQVDFIDQRGVDVVKHFPPAQVTLMSAPGFVTELLQNGGQS